MPAELSVLAFVNFTIYRLKIAIYFDEGQVPYVLTLIAIFLLTHIWFSFKTAWIPVVLVRSDRLYSLPSNNRATVVLRLECFSQ